MRLIGKRTKVMRTLAAVFALSVGLAGFGGVSAWANGMKNADIKKEYRTEDIAGSLVKLGKRAVRTGENAYDITLSLKDNSFEYDKKMPLVDTDVVFVVDTSASMNEGNGWNQLKSVLGDGNKGLVYNILGGDNKDSNNSVTFVGYNGNLLSFSNPDYYISDKFKSSDINKAVGEYADYNKMSEKISDNTAGSNMMAGFRGAGKAFDYLSGKDRKKIAVLITDGDPSIGYTTLANPYTLYSDTDKMPGYDWEAYTQKVWCRYYKNAGNGKYIFSDDEASKRGDGLKRGYTHYGYNPKWRKIIKEGKTKHVNDESILKEAEELKKITSNKKIFTVKVKNNQSRLLDNYLFKDHYYSAADKDAGKNLYNDIYADLFTIKDYTYRANGIKLHEELSDFVELNESREIVINIGINKVVLAGGDEKSGDIYFVSKGNNYALGDIEIRYNKKDKSFNWTIENGIPEGTTIYLTYGVKLNKKAVKPGKGEDEDYKDGVKGLVNTDENTGDYAGKPAYPVSKENMSYVNYGVKEIDNNGNYKLLKGESLDEKFPVAGVRPDIKYWLKIYHKTMEEKEIFQVSKYLEKGSDYFVNIRKKVGLAFKNAYVNKNNKRELIIPVKDDKGNLGIQGKLDQDTKLELYYESKEGKVAVKDIFERYGAESVIVTRLEEKVGFNDEKIYSALTDDELVAKAGKEGYPEDIKSYTRINPEDKKITVDKDTITVEFRYTLKEENIDVYDHFNGAEGIVRQDYKLSVGKGNNIEYVPELTNEAINAMGKIGEWKAVKQDGGKNFKVEKNASGVRSVHFYYVQKAKITIKAHYKPVIGAPFDKELTGIEEDKYFGDEVIYTDKETGSEYELKEVKVNFETIQFNTGENSKTVIFTVDRPEVTVDYYYEKRPEGRIFKNAKHTYKEYNEDGTDTEILAEKSGKEGTEYIFNKKELPGWKLKEVKVNGEAVTEAAAKGLFGDSKKIEFIYEKDMVDIVVENIYSAEDDSIQDEIVAHKVINVQRGTKSEFEPELDEGYGKWETEEGKKEVDTKPDFGNKNETVFKVSFTFKKKKFNVTVVDNFIGLDHEIRSVSRAAVDTLFSVSALSRKGWKLKDGEEKSKNIKLDTDKTIEFKYVKVEKNPAISIYDHFGTNEPTTRAEERRNIGKDFITSGEYYEYGPLVRAGWKAKTGIQNGIAGDNDIELHFFYEEVKSSGGIGGTSPSDDNPAQEPPVADVTEDTIPQGTATTEADSAPSGVGTDETGVADIDDEDVEEDQTPQGITDVNGGKITAEEDDTPRGPAELPKTGGTDSALFGVIGFGLIGLGFLIKNRR